MNRLKQLQQSLKSGKHSSCLPATSQVPTHGADDRAVLPLPQKDKDGDALYPLTEGEANSFLENTLGMKQPKEHLAKDREGFLEEFTLLMNTKVPFTNLTMLSTRDLASPTMYPTLREYTEIMLKLQGGNCFIINMFTKALLDILGFKTFHIGGNNPGDVLFDTHISTVVCDLTFPGSRHLVDPGTARPLYKPIPLDFEEESPIYQYNYMKVKFFKRDHGILLSCSQVPESLKSTLPHIFEHRGLYWKLELMYRTQLLNNRNYWLAKFQDLYIPTGTPRSFQYIRLFGHIGDRYVAMSFVSDQKIGLKFHHSNPNQSETVILSVEKFFALMEKEFPQYPRQMIERALEASKCLRNLNSY